MPTQKSPFSLKGKTVLITGGAGFLGQYFVRALVDAGARVTIAERSDALDAARELAAQVNRGHKEMARAVEMDVTSKPLIERGFREVMADFGQLDVLINNAAIDPKFDPQAAGNEKLFEHYPRELLELSVEVNLIGTFLVTQEAMQYMLHAGGGNIINISSIYGIVGPDQRLYPKGEQKPADYAITKAGVGGLTRWVATTYADRGIRANTYTLGGVLKGHDKDFREAYAQRTPMGRMANPEEVGAPLVFLASDASSYMTGANLIVDGGLTAW